LDISALVIRRYFAFVCFGCDLDLGFDGGFDRGFEAGFGLGADLLYEALIQRYTPFDAPRDSYTKPSLPVLKRPRHSFAGYGGDPRDVYFF
jgi:hypothetical protein